MSANRGTRTQNRERARETEQWMKCEWPCEQEREGARGTATRSKQFACDQRADITCCKGVSGGPQGEGSEKEKGKTQEKESRTTRNGCMSAWNCSSVESFTAAQRASI
jgi:hypothetical protein